MAPRKRAGRKKAKKDNRVTMKMERALWKKVERLVKSHPEWGIVSVPDFVRRAIDHETKIRIESGSSQEITLRFAPDSKDGHRKAPSPVLQCPLINYAVFRKNEETKQRPGKIEKDQPKPLE